jgi:hypothetical protein
MKLQNILQMALEIKFKWLLKLLISASNYEFALILLNVITGIENSFKINKVM